MNTGRIAGKMVVMAGAIIMLAIPAIAGNGRGTSMGQGAGDRTRTQSRDRSCQDAIEHKDVQQLAGTQEMIQLFIKDKDKLQDQDQLQDGSCQAG